MRSVRLQQLHTLHMLMLEGQLQGGLALTLIVSVHLLQQLLAKVPIADLGRLLTFLPSARWTTLAGPSQSNFVPRCPIRIGPFLSGCC